MGELTTYNMTNSPIIWQEFSSLYREENYRKIIDRNQKIVGDSFRLCLNVSSDVRNVHKVGAENLSIE